MAPTQPSQSQQPPAASRSAANQQSSYQSSPVCDAPQTNPTLGEQPTSGEPSKAANQTALTGEPPATAKEPTAAESSPAMALYAPLALVGATSQVIDFNSIAAARNQAAGSGNGVSTTVTVSGSSPATCSTTVNPGQQQPSLVVSQRQGAVETHLSRVDSVKSAGSVNSLAVIPGTGDLATGEQQRQRPIRAILRNRLLPGFGGDQADEEAAALNQGAQSAAGAPRPEPQQPVVGASCSKQTVAAATARSVGYDSSILAKKNSDGK